MKQTPALSAVYEALEARQFFKLICGGSFSDTTRLEPLVQCYAQTGIPVIDVSASLPVVNTVIQALASQAQPPALMVSFPLDSDPHFRKIQLVESDCILCGACVPICPTQVFTLNHTLEVTGPACYGCGRCVPVCPTEALLLEPFSVYPDLAAVLAKPEVTMVEIHTSFADPVMVEGLYETLGPFLVDKALSICLRPQELPRSQVLAFLQAFQDRSPYPVIVQVDGLPMSGSADPEASRPALEAARALAPDLPQGMYLTVSGGINAQTAQFLKFPEYAPIHGVGMGTYARQQVWESLSDPVKAAQEADRLVRYFQTPQTSAII